MSSTFSLALLLIAVAYYYYINEGKPDASQSKFVTTEKFGLRLIRILSHRPQRKIRPYYYCRQTISGGWRHRRERNKTTDDDDDCGCEARADGARGWNVNMAAEQVIKLSVTMTTSATIATTTSTAILLLQTEDR